jgi:uncharacterized protein (TIGR02145 family)
MVHDGSIPELEGMVTYRIYALLGDSTDKVTALYGDAESPLVLSCSTGFYQTIEAGDTSAELPPSLFYSFVPEWEFDSWISLGIESREEFDEAISPPWSFHLDLETFNAGGDLMDHSLYGGMFVTVADENDTYNEAGSDLKVLLAQLTVANESIIYGNLNFQVFLGGDQSTTAYYENVIFNSANTSDSLCLHPASLTFGEATPCVFDCANEWSESAFELNITPECAAIEELGEVVISVSDSTGWGVTTESNDNPFNLDFSCYDLNQNLRVDVRDALALIELVGSEVTTCESGQSIYLLNLNALYYGTSLWDAPIEWHDVQAGIYDLVFENAHGCSETVTVEVPLIPDGYDCLGNCLNDNDGDGVCDEFEINGCQDLSACNFNSTATESDDSCTYPEPSLDCDGNCLNDIDEDGVCDEFEILGCTNPASDNFDLSATEDDNSCITPGCVYEVALNFDPNATYDDNSCQFAPAYGYCGEGTYWDESFQVCLSVDSCPYDLNNDGLVGVIDLLELLSSFGFFCESTNNSAEWTCGDPVNYHGYDYATVQIGEQCWFAENLRTGHYRNGDEIPHLNPVEWGETIEGAFVEWNLNEFGRLYNGYSTVDTRQLCPQDWNIPSDDDWISLEIFIGMSEAEANAWGQRGAQGEDLKQTYENLSDWTDNQAAVWTGSNGFGFNGLPSGNVDQGGVPFTYWPVSYYWTSTTAGVTNNNNPASVSRIIDISMAIGRGTYDHIEGMAVRCIKDSE